MCSGNDGKRKSFYGKTRQEVAKRLAEARHEVDSGFPLPDERLTVGQHLASWFEGACLHLRPSSRQQYRIYVFVHLIPGLGQISLSKLTMQQVQTFYARKLDEGLASTTIHQGRAQMPLRICMGRKRRPFRVPPLTGCRFWWERPNPTGCPGDVCLAEYMRRYFPETALRRPRFAV